MKELNGMNVKSQESKIQYELDEQSAHIRKNILLLLLLMMLKIFIMKKDLFPCNRSYCKSKIYIRSEL